MAAHGSPPPSSCATGLEAAEVAFQRAWVAYLWARAANAGIAPHIAQQRTEHWGHLLLSADNRQQPVPGTHVAPAIHHGVSGSSMGMGVGARLGSHSSRNSAAQELCELSAAMLELSQLGIEQKLWQLRGTSTCST